MKESNGTTTTNNDPNSTTTTNPSAGVGPDALFSPRTKSTAGGVIPGRADVDLSFVRSLANDTSIAHQSGDHV
jgi:hypothetical protein